MPADFLARPWQEIQQALTGAGVSPAVTETRSPRGFFPVDAASPYVVRVQERGTDFVFTLTPAPARSASVAAYEEKM